MTRITDEILSIISLRLTRSKRRDDNAKEFALFYCPQLTRPWMAELGNPTSCVMLGETMGEISGEGSTAEEALEDLRNNIERKAGNKRGR